MKIARYRIGDGLPTWGVLDLDSGTLTSIAEPIEAFAPRITDEGGAPQVDGPPIDLERVTLLAPVTPTTKVVGAGANYLVHLERLGHTERPKTTIAYLKPLTAIVGPDEEIAYPPTTNELDFEVELVAVVGSSRLTGVTQGSRHVLGYTVGNDVSARDAASAVGGIDLFSMKALDRSTPVGPWITTVDELPDIGSPGVEISLRVNGEERQRDSTSNMIFSIDELFEYVTSRVTLCAGDLLFTGTTAGVGKEDGRFLKPGDEIESEVAGVGVLRNRVGSR